MTVKTIKDLKQVIALCRKSGVLAIEIDGVKLQIAPLPAKKAKKLVENSLYGIEMPLEASISVPKFDGEITAPEANISKDELTEEQILFYSSAPSEIDGDAI